MTLFEQAVRTYPGTYKAGVWSRGPLEYQQYCCANDVTTGQMIYSHY